MATGGAGSETGSRGTAAISERASGGASGQSMAEYLLAPPEVTVGLVGPHRLLQQIVLAAGLPAGTGELAGPGSARAGRQTMPAVRETRAVRTSSPRTQ